MSVITFAPLAWALVPLDDDARLTDGWGNASECVKGQ